jgi:ABC-type glycerol-3-phosphate transport system substrate-binding protein
LFALNPVKTLRNNYADFERSFLMRSLRRAFPWLLVSGIVALFTGPIGAQELPELPENEILSFDLLEALSPEEQAFYIPGRFEGQTLDVVLNSTFLDLDRAPLMEAAKTTFEQLTGATVNYIPLPENQMYDQVRLEMSVNSGAYDMMHTGAGGAKDYGLDGFLVPLPMPPDADDFFQGDLNQYMVGDTLYGYPFIADTNIFYWRTDLFEAAGLDPNDPPDTYQEVREYALRLTTDVNGNHPGDADFDPNNIEVYGLAFKGVSGLASSWEWYNYLYAFGGDLFDEEYNVAIDSPEAIASLEWVVDNYREHGIYPPDTPSFDYTEFHTLFLQGKVAMAVNWPYMYNLAQDPEQSSVVGNVAIGAKPCEVACGGNIGGWSWNVFTMSDTPDLATAFAKWMSVPDIGLLLARDAGLIPVRASVAELMTEVDPVLYGAIAENQAVGRSVGWLASGPAWLEIEAIQHQAIQEALIGTKDPTTALQDAKTQIETVLEENNFYDELLPQLLGETS